MPFVLQKIRSGAKVLKPWYGCVVGEGSTIADVFTDFSSGVFELAGSGNAIPDEYRTSCIEARAGKNKAAMIQVSPQCTVSDVVSTLGQYIEFTVAKPTESFPLESTIIIDDDSPSSGTKNAFVLLMASSRQTSSLPTKWEIRTPNKKLEMKNDVIDFLEKNKLGWDPSHVQSCGTTFINTLVDSLWYIDGNHQTLTDRGYAIPAMFEAFTGYNRPEARKKRKRSHTNLTASDLEAQSSSLYSLAGSSYMRHQNWRSVREAVLRLAESLRQYSNYLRKQREAVAGTEGSKRSCVRTDVDELTVLNATLVIKPTLAARYRSLHAQLLHSHDYEPVLLEDHSPADPRRKHDYKEGIVVPVKSVMYTYTGSRNHISFIWRIPASLTETELLQKNASIQQELKTKLPKYHSRAMRREFIHTFGTVTHAKPAFLTEAYRRLTGDASASDTTEQAEVDSRVAQLLETEDPDLVCDLRVLNEGRPETFTVLLDQQYVQSSVETAVDERRHDTVQGDGDVITHLARALSVRDLHEEVTKQCPPGTPIPSVQLLRYQFWPRKPTAATAKRYKGNLKITFMVQSRQFRHTHIDSHYASALFRYEREFAICYRQFSTFICQDDKHTIKVGEPGCPVAAVDRGKAVLVGLNEKLVVGDHDFTRFSITPSVNFEVNIPETIEETFYHGRVHVGLKDSTF